MLEAWFKDTLSYMMEIEISKFITASKCKVNLEKTSPDFVNKNEKFAVDKTLLDSVRSHLTVRSFLLYVNFLLIKNQFNTYKNLGEKLTIIMDTLL